MEDLRGGQRKEVLEDEPVKSGKNKKKETNPDGNRSVKTDPKSGRIHKNRSTKLNSTKYESERKPVQPEDDRTRPIRKEANPTQPKIQKEVEIDEEKKEGKKRHYHG